MPVSIPTSEPSAITAGDTVQWTRSLPDYPATSNVLKYAFQASGKSLITITAAASGADHAVTITADASGNYAPGVYLWTAYVEAGSTRTTVGRGALTILPSPLAALGSTHASRMLVLIEAALEGRIPNGLESTNIDGQQIDRIAVEALERLQLKYQRRVLLEQSAASAAAGLPVRRTLGIRFVRP
ncbi:MAG: hypothetical protein QOE70_4365 [Chthoniobacter sp.]|jgi:hypothetical protein|nr:hypothetical protein [Chthoniobacter sp.]